MSISLKLSELDTPSLLIDKAKLFENIDYCQRRAHELDVNWRPHVKTHKCAPIAAMQVQGMFGGITVSTVKEAEYMFDEEGITDIIYAVGIAPQKLTRIALLNSRGADIKIILDNLASAMAVSEFCRTHNTKIGVLLEIDCDGHRSGLKPDDPALVTVAKALTDGAVFKGVLTHAGDSYLSRSREELEAYAANEVRQIMTAANTLKAAGYTCEIISVGSTPTFTAVKDTEGVTEYRSGVGVFQDLVMAGLNVCKVKDIAISVLVTVIGHQPQKGWIITDGGWMAMSRDRGTAAQAVDWGYGLVCDETGKPIENLWMKSANQEHGIVCSRDGSPIRPEDFPIGTRLRILPNHACPTAAAFDKYFVVDENNNVQTIWPKINNW